MSPTRCQRPCAVHDDGSGSGDLQYPEPSVASEPGARRDIAGRAAAAPPLYGWCASPSQLPPRKPLPFHALPTARLLARSTSSSHLYLRVEGRAPATAASCCCIHQHSRITIGALTRARVPDQVLRDPFARRHHLNAYALAPFAGGTTRLHAFALLVCMVEAIGRPDHRGGQHMNGSAGDSVLMSPHAAIEAISTLLSIAFIS